MVHTMQAATVKSTSLCPSVKGGISFSFLLNSSLYWASDSYATESVGFFLIFCAYRMVNTIPTTVNTIHMGTRNQAPDMTGIPEIPWATARLKGFCQEVPKPIWVAT